MYEGWQHWGLTEVKPQPHTVDITAGLIEQLGECQEWPGTGRCTGAGAPCLEVECSIQECGCGGVNIVHTVWHG